MFSRRNLLIAAVVVAGLAAGGFYLWQQQAAAQNALAQIRQEPVGRGSIAAAVSATGPLSAESQVNLYFGVASPAPVAEVNVALGDPVKQGDVLARLDVADLELSVRQSEQALRSAELALVQLTAPVRPEDLAAAEANLRLAKAQVYQATRGSSAEQLEIARLNLVVAQQNLTQINQRIDDLVEQGKWAEKDALEDQQKQLAEAAQVAQLRYEQAQKAGGSGGSALAAVEQAQVALDQLKRGPNADDVRIAELEVDQAKAALEQARNALLDAQIVAPFDGLVAAVNVRVGEVAAGTLPAVVLVDTRQYHLDVAVDEVDIARIAPGQAVTVTLDALPGDVFAGVVDAIAPQSTVNAGIVSYPVRVVLSAADARLRSGMTATAEIVTQQARDVVLAPNWAIRRDRDSGQAFASVLRDGLLAEIPVELGLRNETFSEVVNGLSAGDVVAVSTTREQFSLFGP
jgi:HlyD family secretion protein